MAGKIVGNEPCPQCRERGRDKTGDHLMIFEDGGGYCNRCEYHRPHSGAEVDEEVDVMTVSSTTLSPVGLVAEDVPSRGLKKLFVELYGGVIEYDPVTGTQSAIWWPRYKAGKAVGWKIAGLGAKTFRAVGDGKDSDLFGMHLDGGRKLCIITEGEADAVAAKQMLAEHGKDYRVVSLPNGAVGAISTDSHAFLSAFETIIIATDNDEKGNEAATKLTELFDAGKCKRAHLPHKDANDCLMQADSQGFFGAIMSARTIMADGVVLGSDTWDTVLKDHHAEHTGGTPYPWEGMSKMVYGARNGELDTWTSGTGMGKTAVMRELIHNWSVVHDLKVGVLSLEEDLASTILGQMSICANLPLHLPEVRATVSDEDLRRYWEMANANDNLVCVDHWGSIEAPRLLQKIRYLRSGMGCEKFVIDHLSILLSEVATDGDERKNIDVLMTKLKRLTEELDIHISLVCHLNTPPSGQSFEEGAVPNLNNLRGSRSIGQLSHGVYALSRDQQHDDPIIRNTSKITILKDRFTGRTGPACLMYYDTETGRLTESHLTLGDYNDGITTDPLTTDSIG